MNPLEISAMGKSIAPGNMICPREIKINMGLSLTTSHKLSRAEAKLCFATVLPARCITPQA